jgi:plasmid stabilization system protein ParE
MKKYEVLFSRQVRLDIANITDYYKNVYCSKTAAVNLAKALRKSLFALSDLPYLYPEVFTLDNKPTGYRKIVVKRCVLLYRIDENRNEIILQRLFHGSQDWLNQL